MSFDLRTGALYIFIAMFESSYFSYKFWKNILDTITYLFLEGNQNIELNQNEVISVLSNFVENEGNLIDKKKRER